MYSANVHIFGLNSEHTGTVSESQDYKPTTFMGYRFHFLSAIVRLISAAVGVSMNCPTVHS